MNLMDVKIFLQPSWESEYQNQLTGVLEILSE